MNFSLSFGFIWYKENLAIVDILLTNFNIKLTLLIWESCMIDAFCINVNLSFNVLAFFCSSFSIEFISLEFLLALIILWLESQKMTGIRSLKILLLLLLCKCYFDLSNKHAKIHSRGWCKFGKKIFKLFWNLFHFRLCLTQESHLGINFN